MPSPITVDLRKDADDIRKMLVEAVSRYAARSSHPRAGPHHGPVSAIALTYDSGFGAHVALDFDSRPDFEPDGTWTHEYFAKLDRPQWESAYEALENHALKIIMADGSTRTLEAGTDDESYATVFGEMLVSLLKSAREAGAFALLPKQARCELGVEEVEGFFGWPAYEDRGKDNLV